MLVSSTPLARSPAKIQNVPIYFPHLHFGHSKLYQRCSMKSTATAQPLLTAAGWRNLPGGLLERLVREGYI